MINPININPNNPQYLQQFQGIPVIGVAYPSTIDCFEKYHIINPLVIPTDDSVPVGLTNAEYVAPGVPMVLVQNNNRLEMRPAATGETANGILVGGNSLITDYSKIGQPIDLIIKKTVQINVLVGDNVEIGNIVKWNAFTQKFQIYTLAENEVYVPFLHYTVTVAATSGNVCSVKPERVIISNI